MNTLPHLTEQDFTLFAIPNLEHRMEAIRSQLQPKFSTIGEQIEAYLSSESNTPFYTHIAKHLRRTKNPPEETWVAWSNQKRGYKAHPHFQVGICESHVFIWFALIYEYGKKKDFAKKLGENKQIWSEISSSFYLSPDHTDSELNHLKPITNESIDTILKRLENVKKAEFLCGTYLTRQEALDLNGQQLVQQIQTIFQQLLPMYQLSIDL